MDASTSGWATAGAAEIRKTARRTWVVSEAALAGRRDEGRADQGLGLRNPWRISFDRLTGDLLIGDVGQGQIEEVDFTPKSSPGLENYGWDVFEGRVKHEDKPLGPGKLVIRSPSTPCRRLLDHRRPCLPRVNRALRGRYIYGDYCSGTSGASPSQTAGQPASDARTSLSRV